jgi:hypothetical protein
MNLGYINKTDKSLQSNSDFSFFNRSKAYAPNKSIFDTKINAVKVGFNFDFRSFIEDGKFRRRVGGQNPLLSFGGSALISSNSLLKSEQDFEIYKFSFRTRINSFASTSMNLRVESSYSNGNVPLQWMEALPGNLEASGKNNSFRTLRFGEVFGDRVLSVFFNYNFGSEIWRLLSIPLLKDEQINLSAYINGAYTSISNSSQTILTQPFIEFKNPFWEAGFGISHPLIPLQFEFTWKLNHRGYNDFMFGINTFIL